MIGGRTAAVVACVYGRAVIEQGMCQGEAAVVLEGSKQRVGLDAVGGLVEAAGVATFEVVALREDGTFVDKTVAVCMGSGDDRVFDGQGAGILKNITSAIQTAGSVSAKGRVQNEGIAAIGETAAIVGGAVAADGAVGDFHGKAKMLDAAAASCLILSQGAVEQVQIAAVGNAAAGGLGCVGKDE